MRPLFGWFGGKGHMYQHIIKHFPDHICFVDVFGGAGSIILNKTPAAIEVFNDIDSGLVNLFRILRDKENFRELVRLCELTPYSREEFYNFRENWMNQEDNLLKAHMWLCVARWSFSGEFGAGWSHSTNTSERSKDAYQVTKWLSAIENLDKVHQRLSVVQIENLSWEKILPKYDNETTLFYLDPPYFQIDYGYEYKMGEEDHENLISEILKLKGKCVISGYESKLYNILEKFGWYTFTFEQDLKAAGKTRLTGILGKGSSSSRTEKIWIKPFKKEESQEEILKSKLEYLQQQLTKLGE